MEIDNSRARKLSELHPNVSMLTLFVAFEQADAEAEPNYQQIIFTPESEAAFRLACSREECVDGGFDYAPVIAELVRSEGERGFGSMLCKGRCGGECCALQSEYRIIVQYLP